MNNFVYINNNDFKENNKCYFCGTNDPKYELMFNIHPSRIIEAKAKARSKYDGMYLKYLRREPTVTEILSENADNFKFVCLTCYSKNLNLNSYTYKTIKYMKELSDNITLSNVERKKWFDKFQIQKGNYQNADGIFFSDPQLSLTERNVRELLKTTKTQVELNITSNKLAELEMRELEDRLKKLKKTQSTSPERGGKLLRNVKCGLFATDYQDGETRLSLKIVRSSCSVVFEGGCLPEKFRTSSEMNAFVPQFL